MTDDQTPPGPALLIVDDNVDVRHLIRQALERLEPRVLLEAGDGVQAQQILTDNPIDVVITDMLMPRMDGQELMRWAQEHCPGPLWIVLSGLDTFDAAVNALQLGAFDFLAKPLRIARLRVAVRNALDQIELRRDRERLYRELEQSNTRLSRRVEQLTSLCRMLENQSELIQEDLARAEVIQRALLPRTPPELDGWCLETLYRPGRYVGGDLYDIFELNDTHLGLVVADAAGHGVAAAMLSVLLKHRLNVYDDDSGQPLEPSEVLRRANAALHAETSASGSFITAAYLLIDRHSGEARLAAAGHPPALWVNGDNRCMLDRTGPALGLTADAEYSQEHFTLAPGDRLLLYTDGLLDGGPNAPSHRDLIDTLATSSKDRATLLQGFYEAATCDMRHDPDDVTIVLLERSLGTSRFDDTTGTASDRPLGAPADALQMLGGDTDDAGFLCVCGAGTWMRSQAFFDAAVSIAEHRPRAIVDLGDCNHLDSTFLGTLYELVTACPESIRLQRIPDRILALFDELSMQAVIDRISSEPLPLPASLQPVTQPGDDSLHQAHRLLKAHEILATLSEENREQFQEVVESLRQDLNIH